MPWLAEFPGGQPECVVAAMGLTGASVELFARIQSAAMCCLVASTGSNWKGHAPLPDAIQEARQIRQLLRYDVDDITLTLQQASAGHHTGRENDAPVPLERFGPDDDIGLASLILDGGEHHPLGTAGSLANEDDAGNGDAPAGAEVRQLGAGHGPEALHFCADERDRMPAQAQANAPIICDDLSSGRHAPQLHSRFPGLVRNPR